MQLELVKQVKDYDALRGSFNTLATATFGLSFEDWYKNRFWTHRYIPYVLTHDGKVVSNVSANLIRSRVNGEPKLYVQLGTVMTDPQYREQGLSRQLIEAVLDDWRDKCDGIYLYANDSVLDFYPRFGFVKSSEMRYERSLTPSPTAVRKLDWKQEADIARFEQLYEMGNPFSALPMLDNFSLLMFHCSSYMSDRVYYLEEFGALAILSFDSGQMTCHDIYCGEGHSLEALLAAFALPDTQNVALGFTPIESSAWICCPHEEEDRTLFVLHKGDDPTALVHGMFPTLSHA